VEFDLEFFAAARQNLGTDRNRTRVDMTQTRQKASCLDHPATVTVDNLCQGFDLFLHSNAGGEAGSSGSAP
jgi:hypothetical protein